MKTLVAAGDAEAGRKDKRVLREDGQVYLPAAEWSSGKEDVVSAIHSANALIDGSASSIGVPLMPTILRLDGYRFYFYSHEPNEPPHVHVDKGSATLKSWLDPVALARASGFRAHEINVILAMIVAHRTMLMEAWHEHFGSGR